MTAKDPEAFDWFLMSLTQQHGGSGQNLLDTIFNFFGRRTEFYTTASVESVQKMVLKKFQKYGADVFEAKEKKTMYLDAKTLEEQDQTDVAPSNSQSSTGISISSTDTTQAVGKDKTDYNKENMKKMPACHFKKRSLQDRLKILVRLPYCKHKTCINPPRAKMLMNAKQLGLKLRKVTSGRHAYYTPTGKPVSSTIVDAKLYERTVTVQDSAHTATNNSLFDVQDSDSISDDSSGNVASDNSSHVHHYQVQEPRGEMSGSTRSTTEDLPRIQAKTSVSKLASEKTSKCLTTNSTFVKTNSAPPSLIFDQADSAENDAGEGLKVIAQNSTNNGTNTSQVRVNPIEKRRSSRNRTKNEIPGKKPKDSENQSSSSNEELQIKGPTITYQPSIKLNPGLGKVKIESDYIPNVKIEQD